MCPRPFNSDPTRLHETISATDNKTIFKLTTHSFHSIPLYSSGSFVGSSSATISLPHKNNTTTNPQTPKHPSKQTSQQQPTKTQAFETWGRAIPSRICSLINSSGFGLCAIFFAKSSSNLAFSNSALALCSAGAILTSLRIFRSSSSC